MIKLESKLINERGIVAFSLEASGADDLQTLDLFNAAIQGAYQIESGFSTSNRLVVHVKGMPEELFKNESQK